MGAFHVARRASSPGARSVLRTNERYGGRSRRAALSLLILMMWVAVLTSCALSPHPHFVTTARYAYRLWFANKFSTDTAVEGERASERDVKKVRRRFLHEKQD